MDETITRSAGAGHGQEMTPEAMEAIIRSIGRLPRQRTTTYGEVPAEPRRQSFLVMRPHSPQQFGAASRPLPARAMSMNDP
jgi:FO synthase